MKNSKLRRALLLVASAVLLVSVSVSATLAYLTSKTEVVTNTFTIGDNINITLLEGKVYAPGNEPSGDQFGKFENENERVTSNSYKLIPNWTYDKDPEVTVLADSGDCYVFVKVVNGLGDYETDDPSLTIAMQMQDNGWMPLGGEGNDGIYYYNNVVENKDSNTVLKVFDTFTTQNYSSVTNAEETLTVTIDAYAIQADGFNDAAAAWAVSEPDFTN